MKTITIKLFLILTILFTFSTCDLIGEIDKCEEVTKITADASMGVRVYTAYGGIPIEGIKVKFETWKTHCNGKKGYPPVHEWTRTTSPIGYASNGYVVGYKLTTEEDVVHFGITLYDKYNKIIMTDSYDHGYGAYAK